MLNFCLPSGFRIDPFFDILQKTKNPFNTSIERVLIFKVSFETSTGGERGSKTFILIPVNMGVHRLFKRTGLPIGALTKLVK